MEKLNGVLGKAILMTPFFIVFAWFTIVVTSKGTTTTAQLSPARLDALVTVLFLFILCYGAFIFYALRKMGKEHKKHKKR